MNNLVSLYHSSLQPTPFPFRVGSAAEPKECFPLEIDNVYFWVASGFERLKNTKGTSILEE